MGHAINYSNMQDGPAKEARAINDIIDYLGKKRFNEFHKILTLEHRTQALEYKAMSFNCSLFAGIEGFPIVAWHNKILNETTWDRDEVVAHKDNLAKLIRAATPKCLHLGDAPERFLNDIVEADENQPRTLAQYVMIFLSLWDEIYGSDEPEQEQGTEVNAHAAKGGAA